MSSVGNYWQGKNIRLRGLEPEDADTFFQWNQDIQTQHGLDQIWFPGSKARVREWAEQKSQQSGEKDEFFFVIEELSSGQIAGMIHPSNCDRQNGTFSYGVGIIEAFRRKGYAQEAIRMVLRYYFEELGYQKVNVGIYAYNEASIKLHVQMGFTEEGRQRAMKLHARQYWDLVLLGMLRAEFS
ncbi:MAG: GNAT family protein [Bacteroidota bacterium]